MTPESEDYTELVGKIRNFLVENYQAVDNPTEADFHYTTQEIYFKLQKLLPSDCYTAAMVANWLHEAGFTFVDYGSISLEWILKRTKYE